MWITAQVCIVVYAWNELKSCMGLMKEENRQLGRVADRVTLVTGEKNNIERKKDNWKTNMFRRIICRRQWIK